MNLPEPELQGSFAASLAEIRASYLQEALGAAVGALSVPEIDRELAEFVPAHSLSTLAGQGLRGELMFPVPSVLRKNARLLDTNMSQAILLGSAGH